MPDVLNPRLFRALECRFGRVTVTNQGQAMIAIPMTNPLTGQPRLSIQQTGEQYALNCPYCNDTRSRLYVSHQYGQRDETGRRLTFLAHCHNEDCLSEPENRRDFDERLSAPEWQIESATIRPGTRAADEAPVTAWPGPVTRLDKLPDEHEAHRYLVARGFDPDRLGRVYGVGYCEQSRYYLATHRIIIPVFDHGQLRGWQARHIGELDWKDRKTNLTPKYFSCPGMKKSLLLYNLDRAKQYRTGVIVEGPTDVWKFGPMSACAFGCWLSEIQRRRFLAAFRRHSAVLLFDPEAFDEPATTRLIRELARAMPGAFAAVKLPDGTDPGSLRREFLREYVAEHAREQGVEVRYTKRD